MTWEFKAFTELSSMQLYEILLERVNVFVVEQQCPYHEIDGLDPQAWHLLGWEGDQLVAYARIVWPDARYKQPSIGRILTTAAIRGTGKGKQLMQEALQRTAALYPGQAIKLSAQVHLETFYNAFDFVRCSEPYDDEGIMHIDMIRDAKED